MLEIAGVGLMILGCACALVLFTHTLTDRMRDAHERRIARLESCLGTHLADALIFVALARRLDRIEQRLEELAAQQRTPSNTRELAALRRELRKELPPA